MKAEQRKELETNTLADKVGHAMQRVRGGSRRAMIIYFLIGLALIVGLFLAYRWHALNKQEASLQWMLFDDGSRANLVRLAGAETASSRAAQLQIAWLLYWEDGVRMMGANPLGATKALADAGGIFQEIANKCKEADDKLLEPQALLGVAVVKENLAIQDPTSLGLAKDAYKQVVERYKESAEGKFAQKRLDILNDKNKSRDLENFYDDMQKSLNVPAFQHPLIPGLGAPKNKGDKDKDK